MMKTGTKTLPRDLRNDRSPLKRLIPMILGESRSKGDATMQAKSLAILLAIYEPREDWLIQLLDSLNGQTYENLKLYVRNDCSPTYTMERLRRVLDEHITKFPYELRANEANVGSNKTFEALVKDCAEEYVAFCDQDDVWLPEKIKNGVTLLENSPLSPTLVCSELRVINGEGAVISPDMAHHRHRHVPNSDQLLTLRRFLPSLSWIRRAYRVSEDEILENSGLDALIIIRLFKFGSATDSFLFSDFELSYRNGFC